MTTSQRDSSFDPHATPVAADRDPSSARSSTAARSSHVGEGRADRATPKRICVFRLGPTLYAFDVRIVRRIVALDGVVPVPNAPAAVLGLQVVHGAAVAVISVPAVLGLPETGDFLKKPSAALVLHLDEELEVAASIDKVESIVDVRKDDLRPRTGDAEPEAVGGVLETIHGGVTILSADALQEKVRALRFRTT